MSKARISSQPKEQTGNVVRDSALGLVSETVEAYLKLNRQLWYAGPLSAAELEMIRLRNARTVGCVFCQAVRYDIASDAGLNESKISQITDEYATSELSDREKLILRFTDHYLSSPTSMDTATQQALAKEFSAEEIAHMSMGLILFNTFSHCAVALGGMPENELPLMSMEIPE